MPESASTRDPGPLTREAPLDPAQILDGRPLTHAADVYRSEDGSVFVAYWSATAGRFTWDYRDVNEVVTILEGEAFVKTSDGKTHHLHPGVTLSVSAGERAEWHVPSYVRKVAVVQHARRSFLQRATDKLKKLVPV